MSVWITYPGLECETAIETGDGQYLYYDDGSAYWRKGVRDSKFVYDKTITPLGFDGVENTDWEEVNSIAKL